MRPQQSRFFDRFVAHPLPELTEFVLAKKQDILRGGGCELEASRLISAVKMAIKVCARELYHYESTRESVGRAPSGPLPPTESENSPLRLSSFSSFHEPADKKSTCADQMRIRFVEALKSREVVCGLAVAGDKVPFIQGNPNARYLICLAPLDGPENVEVNASIGTLISVYRRVSEVGKPVEEADFVQSGRRQALAGYVLYGASVTLVITFGKGVHGFTLEPSLGTFFLSHPNITCPGRGYTYSVNQGNFRSFPPTYQSYLRWCGEYNPAERRPYSLRYSGSLVADVHRNLLRGGINLYPPSRDSPEGQLYLVHHANPIALLYERSGIWSKQLSVLLYLPSRSGGKATDGQIGLLDVVPSSIDQKTPLICGSHFMMEEIRESFDYYKNK